MFPKLLAFLFLLFGLTAAAAIELKVVNNSDYEIYELYVSSADKKDWGADQLRDGTIDAGEDFTVKNIPPGLYDVKVVDEDGTECVIEAVDFSEGKEMTITNTSLARCEKFGK